MSVLQGLVVMGLDAGGAGGRALARRARSRWAPRGAAPSEPGILETLLRSAVGLLAEPIRSGAPFLSILLGRQVAKCPGCWPTLRCHVHAEMQFFLVLSEKCRSGMAGCCAARGARC